MVILPAIRQICLNSELMNISIECLYPENRQMIIRNNLSAAGRFNPGNIACCGLSAACDIAETYEKRPHE